MDDPDLIEALEKYTDLLRSTQALADEANATGEDIVRATYIQTVVIAHGLGLLTRAVVAAGAGVQDSLSELAFDIGQTLTREERTEDAEIRRRAGLDE